MFPNLFYICLEMLGIEIALPVKKKYIILQFNAVPL